jgi:hypothetical protein
MVKTKLSYVIEKILPTEWGTICSYCEKTARCPLCKKVAVFTIEAEDQGVLMRHGIKKCKYYEPDENTEIDDKSLMIIKEWRERLCRNG